MDATRHPGRSEGLSDEEAQQILDEILKEDEQEDFTDTVSLESCPAACAKEKLVIEKCCDCLRIAENSSRFLLRLMEAMRSLQYKEDELLPTSTIEDIVDYIEANYRDDGDLYAQVRTGLKQVCSQGFVMELLDNEYHLVGPDAITMNRVTCSNNRGGCLSVSSVKIPPRRRKRDSHDDDCHCEISAIDETGPETKRRCDDLETEMSLEDREEDVVFENPECTCNLTVAGEEVALHDTPNGARKNGRDEVRRQRKERTNNQGRNRSARTGIASMKSNVTTTRNRTIENGRKRGKKDSARDGTALDILDDVHEESQAQIRTRKSDQRDKELARWIKRCQEECERRGKQRPSNN